MQLLASGRPAQCRPVSLPAIPWLPVEAKSHRVAGRARRADTGAVWSTPRRDPVGPGQESVWDYPRPPALVRSQEHVRVVHAGVVVADSTRTWRILETAHAPAYYIPADDVRTDLLVPNGRGSTCEFKGRAGYADLAIPGHPVVRDACWSYARPTPAYGQMAGAICFYPQRVDQAWVDDELVTPLQDDFYGDWPTSRIAGPWKGGPGTRGW